MTRFVSRYLTSASVIAGVAVSQAAFAQDQAPEEKPASTGNTIVVTAPKRAQEITDVPQSLVVVSDEQIARSGFERVTDLQFSTPGFVQTGQENSGWVQLTMRGISTPTVTTGFAMGIGMFIDGIDQGMPYSFNQELVEVERVEVLRGPQSTIFGRNTIAGAFNITTKKPSDELRTYVTADIGNYDLFNVSGSVSGPIGEGFYAGLSLYSRQRDGFAENVVTGNAVNDQDQMGGRLQLRFEPSERLTVDVSADLLIEDRLFAYHAIIADTPGGIDYTGEIPGQNKISHEFDPSEKRDLWGGGVNVEYEFDSGFIFNSLSGYRYGRNDIIEDTDHTSRYDQNYISYKNFDQFTQEFRLTSPTAEDWDRPYDFLVGTYFLTQDANQVLGYEYGPDSGLTPETMFAPSSLQSLQVAAFGHGNYYLAPGFSINAGLRVDYERRKMAYSEEGYQDAFAFPETPYFEDQRSETNFSPAVGFDYKFAEDMLFYGKASLSYKSGAFDLGIFKGGQGDYSFDSEELKSYEMGFRGSFLDNRMNVGLAAYYMDYSSLQIELIVPNPNPNLPDLRSRGDAAADIYGVEFEAMLRPVRPLQIDGGFAYTDAQFKDDTPTFGGNQLANSPKWTAYTNATLEFDVEPMKASAFLRGEWTYRSSWFSFPTNFDFERPPGFHLFNARAGFEFDNGMEFSVWGKNLANKEYCTELWDILGGYRCGISRPRTFGVTLAYRR